MKVMLMGMQLNLGMRVMGVMLKQLEQSSRRSVDALSTAAAVGGTALELERAILISLLLERSAWSIVVHLGVMLK